MNSKIRTVILHKDTLISVLYSGWTPVLIAMSISSMGGLILDKAVTKFEGIAVFQPVFNGVGGNLVAVQASRISSYLHFSKVRLDNFLRMYFEPCIYFKSCLYFPLPPTVTVVLMVYRIFILSVL